MPCGRELGMGNGRAVKHRKEGTNDVPLIGLPARHVA